MQANEFVKEHGWDKAKELLAKANGCASIKSMGHHFLYSDLERLVESWELVESLGGLVKAKTNLSSVEYNLSKSVWFGEDKLEKENFASRLRQAIADVESCHES